MDAPLGDRTPPGTPQAPVSTLEDLRREVRQFRPVDVLARCRALSLEIADEHGLMEIEIPPEVDRFGLRRRVLVAPYSVALIARLSLIEGSQLALGDLDALRFRRLLRIVAELDDPSLSAPSLLLRTWDEQAWCQRDLKHAMGRGLTWYRDIPQLLVSPTLDLPSEFSRHVGLTVEEFFGVAFLVFAIASSRGETPYQHFTTMRATPGLSDRARELISSERVRSFLRGWQTSQEAFRASAKARNPGTVGLGRYDFNPLWERPLVSIQGAGQIAPIPQLIIQLFDNQPYWRLREAHRGPGVQNLFASFFGKEIFERYIGLLLEDRMPGARLLPEDATSYATDGDRRGPDWIVVQGTTGFAIEATLAEVPRQDQPGQELDALRSVVKRDLAPRVSRMPEKIAALVRARPDLGLDVVRQWHWLLVTRAAVPWIGYTKTQLIEPEVNGAATPFHVLSIEELESLLAAEAHYGVGTILKEAEERKAHDMREFLADQHRQLGRPFDFGMLNERQHEFFSSLVQPTGQAG